MKSLAVEVEDVIDMIQVSTLIWNSAVLDS